MIEHRVTKDEAKVIEQITKRARQMIVSTGIQCDISKVFMDISTCHSNGCRLNLNELLHADTYDFFHDVVGITKYLNRTTGKLEHFFCPRSVEKEL